MVELAQALTERLGFRLVHRLDDDVDRDGRPCRLGGCRQAPPQLIARRVPVRRDPHDDVDAARAGTHVTEQTGIAESGEQKRVLH